MSEADGVDGGAICKRGFTHLQFAEKLEAPEAERHLGSWILEIKLWSGDTGLRETTTNSSVRPIVTVNGSVLLRISTSTHRSSCSTHSPQNYMME
uniref:Uncharacterized protein n=1 Tax=Vespula pensylvanica TaxID=30213 RepID=A0A834PEQ3_VESPE|nr:hypothetical protein H0235_000902 [Vespula pensylvanica]